MPLCSGLRSRGNPGTFSHPHMGPRGREDRRGEERRWGAWCSDTAGPGPGVRARPTPASPGVCAGPTVDPRGGRGPTRGQRVPLRNPGSKSGAGTGKVHLVPEQHARLHGSWTLAPVCSSGWAPELPLTTRSHVRTPVPGPSARWAPVTEGPGAAQVRGRRGMAARSWKCLSCCILEGLF